jgi:hypothetical protein
MVNLYAFYAQNIIYEFYKFCLLVKKKKFFELHMKTWY